MDGGKIDGLKIYVGRAQKKAEREFVKEREKKKVTGPTNLYIKYLHEDIDDDELYSMFSSFGEIVQGGVKVVKANLRNCHIYYWFCRCKGEREAGLLVWDSSILFILHQLPVQLRK